MGEWQRAGRSAAAQKLLKELVALQQRLLEADEPGHIDLVTKDLNEADYAVLRETLGEGEVLAQVTNFGRVSVIESGYSGIWWVTHLDEEGHVLSDFLEVSYCPEALITDEEDVKDSQGALKAHLFELEMAKKRT